MESVEITAEEMKVLERVGKLSDQSDRTSWKRKETNISKLVTEVQEVQDKALELELEIRGYYDKINEYRNAMVDTCIHPIEHIRVIDWSIPTHYLIVCKFCNKQLTITKD